MKRVGGLFDELSSFSALRRAAYRSARGKRLSLEAASFLCSVESEVLSLSQELRSELYVPGEYKQFTIYERKPRLICAAPFRDRVVHHAVCEALEPMFSRFAIFDSYACQKGKGQHRAIKRAQQFACRGGYVLRLDIKSYFASVDRAILFGLLTRKIKDAKLLRLLSLILASGPTDNPDFGIPIGNLTSQQFANFYLGHLDHFVKEQLRIKRYLRYMDDMVFFSDDKEELRRCEREVCTYLDVSLSLQLNSSRTELVPVCEGFSFLGFRVWPAMIRLGKETKKRLVRRLRQEYRRSKEDCSQEELYSVRSILGHVSQADARCLCRSILFSELV